MILFVILYVLMSRIEIVGTLLLTTFLIANILQQIYFSKNPSITCLRVINAYNILIACLRFYEADNGNTQSESDNYFNGATYICLHLGLLHNPTFTPNILVLFIILVVNILAEFMKQGNFCYLLFIFEQ
jgi:hypothetical protein